MGGVRGDRHPAGEHAPALAAWAGRAAPVLLLALLSARCVRPEQLPAAELPLRADRSSPIAASTGSEASPVGPGAAALAAPAAPVAPVDLPVPDHGAAVAWIPPDDGSSRPVLVATHGAGGTPESLCALWREMIGDGAFILCPRGVTMDLDAPPAARGYFYPTHPALRRETLAALAALRARFGDRVDARRAIYTGFSQGAIMGALAFSLDPAPFAGLVLVEGGAEEWSLYTARRFKAGGGRRVVLACGRRACTDAARRSARYLEREGIEARVVDASDTGHSFGGAVRAGVEASALSIASTATPSSSRSPASFTYGARILFA